MDNLTHTLVGLLMARCGPEKTTVRGAGMMMLAANAPDIDAITWFDRVNYLDYHRSYTHAFAMAPVVALLPMVLARVKWGWQAYLAALAAVLTHPLLDWTNPFGIQIYLPFSHRRTMLDITNVIDPWIWLMLIAAAAAPALSRGAFGGRKGWAIFGLAALLSYEGVRFASHAMAVETMETRLYDGEAPRQVIAVPSGMELFGWRGIVETKDGVRILHVNVQGEFDPTAGRVYHPSAPGPAIEAAKRTRAFQVFGRFSLAPFWKTIPVDGGTQVELIDLRFGAPDAPGFAAVSAVVPN